MDKQTAGTVVATTKQWWLKVNRKPMRMHALDGAEFPSSRLNTPLTERLTEKENGLALENLFQRWEAMCR